MKIFLLACLSVILFSKSIPQGYITPIPSDALLKRKIITNFGEVTLQDGLLDEKNKIKVLDEYKYIRYTSNYFDFSQAVWLEILHKELAHLGITDHTKIALTRTPITSKTVWSALDPNLYYFTTILDVSEHNLLLELPDNFTYGMIQNRWGETIAVLKPNKTYLLLSPSDATRFTSVPNGTTAIVTVGEFDKEADILKPQTNLNYFFLQAPRENDISTLTENLSIKSEDANTSVSIEFIDISQTPSVTLLPKSARFFKILNDIVKSDIIPLKQEKQLQELGITKNMPFMPPLNKRAIYQKAALTASLIKKLDLTPNNTALRDPKNDKNLIGEGIKEIVIAQDINGSLLQGNKEYQLDIAPIDAQAWSITLYDAQTKSMLQSPLMATPYKISTDGSLTYNKDGSLRLYFSSTLEGEKIESNLIKTVKGKNWFAILRVYKPSETFFAKTHRFHIKPLRLDALPTKSEKVFSF